MRNLLMVSVAAVSLLCTSSVMAADKKDETKSKGRYGHGNSNPISTIENTSNRMAEILRSELRQVLRGAKSDFQQVKRFTRGNYQAEEAVHRLGESMSTVDDLCKKLEERLLPRMMDAVQSLSHGNDYGHDHGNDYDDNYGGGNHGGGYSHGNGMSAMDVDSLMRQEIAGQKKLRVLENSVRYVRLFDGQSIVSIVRQFVSASDQARACEIIGRNAEVRMSSQDLYMTLQQIISDSDKLVAGKALVRGVSDLNPMTAERISQTFISLRARREFKNFALGHGGHY